MSGIAGKLYIIATPIGNLADISERAIATLSAVDRILVEDTRHSKKLLNHFNIHQPLTAYHDHNESEIAEQLIAAIAAGENYALISDAGTPCISDPGYRLIAAAHRQGIVVVPIPGASAVISALSASGLVVEPFQFLGFVPSKVKQRQLLFQQLANSSATIVFYESPHRIVSSLTDAVQAFGAERPACLARELTKLHEELHTDRLAALADWLNDQPEKQRGEFVVIVEGLPRDTVSVDEQELVRVLRILMVDHSTKQASALAAEILGVNKNRCYDLALTLKAQS